MLRPVIAATALGAAVGSLLAGGVLFARADGMSSAVSIDNFSFSPATLTVKAGTTVTWTNRDDIPHGIASSNSAFKRSQALDTDDSYSFTFTAPGTYPPAHGGLSCGASGNGQQRDAITWVDICRTRTDAGNLTPFKRGHYA